MNNAEKQPQKNPNNHIINRAISSHVIDDSTSAKPGWNTITHTGKHGYTNTNSAANHTFRHKFTVMGCIVGYSVFSVNALAV